MSQRRALPTVLEVLDDGLRLYRRHLGSFVMIATTLLVVLALLALGFMTFVRTQIGTTSGWTFLGFFVLALIAYPLVLYAFAALSRATNAALDGQPVTLGAALRIGPARGCGMVLFNMLFGTIAVVITSIFSSVISCPLAYVSILLAAVSSQLVSASFIPLAVLFPMSWLWSIMMFGAWLASMVYALQAFVLEQRPWGEAAGRTLDFVAGRFGQSLLMFIGAGAIFGTLTLSYLGSLLALINIVQDRFGLELPPLAGDVLTIVLSVASLVVLLPPLAIWMAMFYRRLGRERDGEEISRRVQAWRDQLAVNG